MVWEGSVNTPSLAIGFRAFALGYLGLQVATEMYK
jgi:hypothetical protein